MAQSVGKVLETVGLDGGGMALKHGTVGDPKISTVSPTRPIDIVPVRSRNGNDDGKNGSAKDETSPHSAGKTNRFIVSRVVEEPGHGKPPTQQQTSTSPGRSPAAATLAPVGNPNIEKSGGPRRASSESDRKPMMAPSGDRLVEKPAHEPYVFLGVCAMAKKARSKYMTEILSRITQEFEQIRMIIFPENVIMDEPVEKWPLCDALISFYSGRFPLDKAVQYAKLRKPLLVNDLEMQYAIQDRRKVYEILADAGVELPRYAVLDRDCGDPEKARLEEFEDHVIVNGSQFNKPFVEKPICAEDHNICIYYPSSAGSGSQRLFRKIGTRSSVYSNESKVRTTGSYIYEEFMPTDGTDVKVYTVGPEYAHAEARKSPALDGVVERDKEGKELRFPIILNNIEKIIARRVCTAFKQSICGFDLLRANGRSYVCDVNGFSFVKNSTYYYNDFAKIIGNMVLRKLAPELHIRWSMPYQLEDPPIVPTTIGQMMELRCVLAVIRHGDRTPKQKMKMELRHPKFVAMFQRFGGRFDGEGREIKLKRPTQLQDVLDVVRDLLANHRGEAAVKEARAKLVQLKSVLEMYGHFSGINRKVQIKYQPLEKPESGDIVDAPEVDTGLPGGTLVLIMKWGGELTPLGKYQSEQLGQMFRCMYPGSGEASMKRGHGLLRLHSTFRHDLKIYASDEGRVQTTAAAFAKGLLALEGELTPILMQMVKSANTNGLLDSDVEARDFEKAVKKTLKTILKQNRDFTEADHLALNPTNCVAVKQAMDAVKNPVKSCMEMHLCIQELNVSIKEKAVNPDQELPMLYTGESWDLLQRRWGKLDKDFRQRDGNFDITKIPDIYDMIRYDMHHNQWMARLPSATRLFTLARQLSDLVIPLEYGIAANEKLAIAQGICTPLLQKIRADLRQVVTQTDDEPDENSNKINPRYSDSPWGRLVRSRLYFTSESHIHSLVNILRFGGLFEESDRQWIRAREYLSRVPELNFLTQIVIMLYEDSSKSLDSDDRFHVELHFSSGMLRRTDYKDMYTVKSRRNSVQVMCARKPVASLPPRVVKDVVDFQSDESHVSTLDGNDTVVTKTQPGKASSVTHLADGEKGESSSTINYLKSKRDKFLAKVREIGIIRNRIFSTAVIKGLDHATPSLQSATDDPEDELANFHVPNVKSLETIHNALSFILLDRFVSKVLDATYRNPSNSGATESAARQRSISPEVVEETAEEDVGGKPLQAVSSQTITEPEQPVKVLGNGKKALGVVEENDDD